MNPSLSTVDNESGSAAPKEPALKEAGPRHPSTGLSAALVAAGILLSRITGLVRESVFAHYFGNTDAADAFKAANKIPNILQMLFGEGVLSASFIPVYARLLAEGDEKEARKVAGAIFTLLTLSVSVVVLVGVFIAPYMIDLIAWGFQGAKRELTIRLVRIFFPAIGLLVISAWCLGILNSHRKFFLSYSAPVALNLVLIAFLIGFGGHRSVDELAVTVTWGYVAGSLLQIAVQFPTILRLLHGLPLAFDYVSENVRTIVKNFVPVFTSRGVVQISSYIDQVIASFLGTGAVAGLAYALLLSQLPVSLFGMSVSAAELPAMSSVMGDEAEIANRLRLRLNYGLKRIAFFVVPSAIGFLALGDIVSGGVYQSGKFTHSDAIYVWGILAGSSVGLLASTLGRLYSSTYYALRDTRTPLRYAIVRVILTSILGFLFAIPLPKLLGIDLKWGAAGLTASFGIAGWVEFLMLRRTLNKRIGQTGLSTPYVTKLWLAATCSAGAGWVIKLAVGHHNPRLVAVLVIGPYALIYFAITAAMGISEAGALLSRVARMAGLGRGQNI
jgi:putative peptidoglycan lipid II flippase